MGNIIVRAGSVNAAGFASSAADLSGPESGFGYLTNLHQKCIFICMRTTLNIDDRAIKKASELTGVKAKTTLVRLALEALIARESAKRLADLGGTETQLRPIPRRRAE